MLQMLISTLREGIEAFLIVAIAAAYLRKTGRESLLVPVWWGTATAAVLSCVLGVFLAEVAVTPFWEGVLALVAAALVISMAIFMVSAAKHMRANIGQRLELAAQKSGNAAWIGVFLFTVLMITREGMEMAFITAALSKNEDSGALVAGAIGGIAAAALLAWAWARYGRRINLAIFFQVTSIFLVLFSLQLLLYAFHEFTEANALPIDNAYWHIATEEWAEGTYGQIIAALLVLLPLAWMAYALLRNPGAPRQA